MTVKNDVKRLRSNGMSQSDIARELGISRQVVHYHVKLAGTQKAKKSGRSRSKRYRDKNPEKCRQSRFKSIHGIDMAEALLLKREDGNCEICKTRAADSFDHNHKNGKHRGWLCRQCNSGLGMFKDDVGILISAIEYLKKNSHK